VRLNRVFVEVPLEPGARVRLGASAAGHVERVLRLRTGEALTLFNGTGGEYAATLTSARGAAVVAEVGEHRTLERESPLRVMLAQGISRGERMDLIVQKATELGVAALLPLLAERSVVRLDAAQSVRKLEHWRAITIAACEQCGRNRLPHIAAPATLAEVLEVPRERAATRLLLSPAATLSVAQIPRPADAVLVLIGPEGGLTPREQELALAAGFTGVRMGPRVLRTETAAIAALTLLQREFGDLQDGC
jgi:16S rRNA (uracil1498-N3)-methyltransferase